MKDLTLGKLAALAHEGQDGHPVHYHKLLPHSNTAFQDKLVPTVTICVLVDVIKSVKWKLEEETNNLCSLDVLAVIAFGDSSRLLARLLSETWAEKE